MKNSQNMIPQIWKCVVSLSPRRNYQLHKPPLCYSVSAFFFSTSLRRGSKSYSSVALSEYLINQHQFSPEAAFRKVTELLLSYGNLDISFVVNHPELLICSVDHRLRPRLDVLKILEKKNPLDKKPSLTTVCKISDKQFSEKYVVPYLNEMEGKFLENEHSQGIRYVFVS